VGDLEELVQRARRGIIDTVYITFPMRAEDRIRDVLAKLADTTASVYIVPDFFVFELLHARWTNVNGLPAVSVFENPLHGFRAVANEPRTWYLDRCCYRGCCADGCDCNYDQGDFARIGILSPTSVRFGWPANPGVEVSHDEMLRQRRKCAAGDKG